MQVGSSIPMRERKLFSKSPVWGIPEGGTECQNYDGSGHLQNHPSGGYSEFNCSLKISGKSAENQRCLSLLL